MVESTSSRHKIQEKSILDTEKKLNHEETLGKNGHAILLQQARVLVINRQIMVRKYTEKTIRKLEKLTVYGLEFRVSWEIFQVLI